MYGEIVEKLNRLADMQSQYDAINQRFTEARNNLITREVAMQIDALEEERKNALRAVDEGIKTLESDVKESVLQQQKTVDGVYLQAVYCQPRITWDTKGLEGYATAYPELLSFRREGNPFVTIRKMR